MPYRHDKVNREAHKFKKGLDKAIQGDELIFTILCNNENISLVKYVKNEAGDGKYGYHFISLKQSSPKEIREFAREHQKEVYNLVFEFFMGKCKKRVLRILEGKLK